MKKETTEFDFESLYARYPRHEGKKAGMAKLAKTIKTTDQYRDLERALENYVCQCIADKTERKFVKHWGTFCNNWTDYVMVDAPAPTGTVSQLQRIMKGEL